MDVQPVESYGNVARASWVLFVRVLTSATLLSLAGIYTLFPTTTAHAEYYVGGYGGLSYPGAFSNVTLSDPTVAGGVSGARVNDLELKSALVGGVKAGYFFISRPWLGLETDVFTLKPDVKQQVVVGGTADGRVFARYSTEYPASAHDLGGQSHHTITLHERSLSTLWWHWIRSFYCQ